MIQYDTPIEVTKRQYTRIMNELAGICAGREEGGKFYIKCLLMKYARYVEQILK